MPKNYVEPRLALCGGVRMERNGFDISIINDRTLVIRAGKSYL